MPCTPDMAVVLRQIELAMPSVTWSRLPDGPVDPAGDLQMTSWKGVAPGLFLTIVRWESTKGRGSGCDGVAVVDGMVIHLTPELATRACGLASAVGGG